MSEEAAFLEALKANAADDTVRLVYADWLDEHAEPAKAEYLRLVATLALAEEDYARDQPHVSRLLALAETLPQEWRVEAGSRFKLVFYACEEAAKKVRCIKAVREVSGEGLAFAKCVIEGAPRELLAKVPLERGLIARDAVREASGTVYLHPHERTDRPVAVFYDILAAREPDMGDPTRHAECKTAFAIFLQTAMNLGAVQARRFAEHEQLTIARHQDPVSAGERVRTLRRKLEWVPTGEDEYPEMTPAWGIWVWTTPTTRTLHPTE